MTCVPTEGNLCTNPSFEVDLTGWDAQSSPTTHVRATDFAWVGTASLRLAGNSQYMGTKFLFNTQIATYTASFYIKGTAGDTGRLLFFNGSAGTVLDTFTLATSDWERHWLTGAINTAENNNFFIDKGDTSAAFDWRIDAVLIEQAATPSDYCQPTGNPYARIRSQFELRPY
jgi:hypothetical protein